MLLKKLGLTEALVNRSGLMIVLLGSLLLLGVFPGAEFFSIWCGIGIALGCLLLGTHMQSSPSSSVSSPNPRIVIIGAGFAGLRVARGLRRSKAEIVMVDRNNYHTFIPLLYQVVTGFIAPSTIAHPIRNWLRHLPQARFLWGEVKNLDLAGQRVMTADTTLDYDYLVLATGSQTRFLGVPGAPAHTFGLRTLKDAIALRHQILWSLEQADQSKDPRYLTFVVVGGGPTGVELAGALREHLDGALGRDYPTLELSRAQIILIHSGDTLLAGFPPSLGRYTARQLRRRKIEIRLQTKVTEVHPQRVRLSDGDSISTATIIWTAGILAAKPNLSQPENWQAATDIDPREKLVVAPTLQLTYYPNVYAAGDVAHVKQGEDILLGVAPEALQQGDAIAANIQRQLKGLSPKPFQYFDKGQAAIIARHAGVAYLFSKIKVQGTLAWLLWLGIHLYYLPGLGNRFILLMSWLQDYIGRDRAHRQLF